MNLYIKKWRFMISHLFILLLASGLPLTLSAEISPISIQSPCSTPMSDAEVAALRGISVKTVKLLHTQRGMLNSEICSLSEAKLKRAISKAHHPKPDHPGEAAAFRNLQLQDEKGFIPADAFINAKKHIDTMANFAPRAPLTGGIDRNSWEWIGPGNIGGRIRSIVIHPTNPNKMWIGSVSGGIWETTDGGASWLPVWDFMPNLAISTMVMDPTNSNVMYAGTGEGFYNADGIRGAGVFKSTDGGTSWSRLASTANSSWYYVNRLAMSPDGATLLAATNSGIWRSTGGGSTWSRRATTRTLDIDFHPTDNNRAIAGDGSGNAYYSTNGGITWTTVSIGGGRVEVTYAPSTPTTVYASVDQNSGEIWKSTDGGASYTRVNTGNNFLGGQGWYDNIIWVDPTNANTVIVGGIDLWRSTDGGATLTKISRWWSAPASAHADHHVIVAHPNFNGSSNKTVFFGNDGGIYKADDVYTVAGTSGWQELNNNLGITQFYGAAGNVSSGVIVGGTQDNGTLRYNGGTETWTAMFGGDGGFCAADPSDPNYFYGEYVYLQIHRSTDGGISSSFIYNGITDAGSNANFIAPFILDPNNPNTLLAGGASLWRSTNVKASTPSWTAIKSSVGSRISAIAVAKGDSNTIWVGHNNGNVYKSTNGGTSWTQVDTSLPNRYVMRIAIDANNHNIVYVTFSGFSSDNVWRSANAGSTWADITGSGGTGLPDAPVRSLVIHPTDSAWLYVGTEVGIFVSEDTGATWNLPHDGPATVSVDELFWMGNTLIAASHGRGLFKNAGPGGALSFSATSYSANEHDGSVDITVTRTNGSQGAASVDYSITGGTATSGGTDYTATASGTFNWGDGDANPKTIVLNVVNDTLVEGNETVEFSLSNFSGAGMGSSLSTTVTIVDDERLKIPYANDFNTDNGGFRPVVLSGSGGQWEWGAGSGKPNFNGTYATIEGAANWMTNLTSHHGWNTKYALETPAISLVGGTGDYFLNFKYRGAAGSNGGTAEKAGMNIEYSTDGGNTWQLLGYVGDPNGNADWYTDSSLDGLGGQAGWFKILFSVFNPTYKINFLIGQSNIKFRFVFGAGNRALDGFQMDNFKITGNPLPAAGTIQFSAAAHSVNEGDGTASITVTRTGGSGGIASVDYATSNGSATAGSDYSSANGTLTWGNGDSSSRTITIPITDDSNVESAETVNLSLSNFGGASAGSLSNAVLTLTDNDGSSGGSGRRSDVIVDFGYWDSDNRNDGEYHVIFMWTNNGEWVPLHTVPAKSMVTGDLDGNGQDDVIVDFGDGIGIRAWMNNSNWAWLHDSPADSMVTGDLDGNGQDDVIIGFGANSSNGAIWAWMNNSNWVRLRTASAKSMATGDLDGSGQDDLIVDFGDGTGIRVRMNNTTWAWLHDSPADSMETGDLDGNGQDDVIIDFGNKYGIWIRMNNSNWVRLHTASAKSMVTGDLDGSGQDDLIVDFGYWDSDNRDDGKYPVIFAWMNNAAWVGLHSLPASRMVTGDLDGSGQVDVIVDFGDQYGIWRWMNNSSWVQLHSVSADSIATGNIDGLASVASSNNLELSDALPKIKFIELPKAELGVQLP